VAYVAFPEFMAKREVVLELTMDQLKSYVKLNIFRDADIRIEDGKIYLLIPLELFIQYEVQGDKIVLKIPTKV
jgi:hypothetical protein